MGIAAMWRAVGREGGWPRRALAWAGGRGVRWPRRCGRWAALGVGAVALGAALFVAWPLPHDLLAPTSETVVRLLPASWKSRDSVVPSS